MKIIEIFLAKCLTASSDMLDNSSMPTKLFLASRRKAKGNKMMDCNWMVTLANAQRKALINLGYTTQQVNGMSLNDTTQELKSLGYNFKANSPFKNK